MKISFEVFVIAVLLMQAWGESSSVKDPGPPVTSIDGESDSVMDTVKGHRPHKINCNGACWRRCSKTSRKKVCHRACNTCCQRCRCVPPGTSGNRDACPCYANLRTHGNTLKCP